MSSSDHDDYMAAVSDYDAESRRDDYRQRCRYYQADCDGCAKYSRQIAINGNYHVDFSCDGNCLRMRRYDKKLKGGEK